MVLAKDLKKERNFAGQIVTFFYESLFVKSNHTHTHTDMIMTTNQKHVKLTK